MRKERFACKGCRAFYECRKPHMKAAAGGWEEVQVDGQKVTLCRPGQARRGGREMTQYAYYCLATPTGKKIANMADYTGLVPKWCPLEAAK